MVMRFGAVAVPARAGILFVTFLFLFGGCGSDSTNEPPTVLLDPGLVEGDTVNYKVTVSWSGSDPDGQVDHFEYALDPPASFTETEIAEGGPGITSVDIPGSGDEPPVTRVSKVLDGETVHFDWVHTEEMSHEFLFASTEADSSAEDSLSASRFHGMHALYVRAVDDDGAASEPDRAAFTSTTVAPVSRILSPVNEQSYPLSVCLQETFRWEGQDPDGDPPTRFLYKLISLEEGPGIPEFLPPPTILFSAPGDWVEFTGTELTLELVPLKVNALGIRAIDAAGAVEPFLDWNRNALNLIPFAQPLRVTIRLEGHSIASSSGPSSPTEIPASLPIQLTWSAASECDIYGYSWGLDLVSTDDSDRGWSSWSHITESPPLSLSSGTHFFYVRVRTVSGTTVMATARLEVLAFAPDLEVLFVDDCFDNLSPRDSEHDAFWNALIDAYVAESGVPRDQFGEFSVHGPDDRGNLQPTAPLLSELFDYKLVIWENHGAGYNADSALLRSTGLSSRLSWYLRSGGKLWLGGRMTVGATTPAPNLVSADLTYPKELGPGDWAWDFLKLRSSQITNDKGMTNANRLHSVWPVPGFPALYDSMVVDVSKLPFLSQQFGGITHADAMYEPRSDPGLRGSIDVLYAYGSAGREVQGRDSPYHGRVCALRWHDPDPAPEHGRIQWFGFAMYFFRNDQALDTFTKSLDWFREGP